MIFLPLTYLNIWRNKNRTLDLDCIYFKLKVAIKPLKKDGNKPDANKTKEPRENGDNEAKNEALKTLSFEKKHEPNKNGAKEIPTSKEQQKQEEERKTDDASAKVDNVGNDYRKEKKVLIYVREVLSNFFRILYIKIDKTSWTYSML